MHRWLLALLFCVVVADSVEARPRRCQRSCSSGYRTSASGRLTYSDVRRMARAFAQGNQVEVSGPRLNARKGATIATFVFATVDFPAWEGAVSAYQRPIQHQILLNTYRGSLFCRGSDRRVMEPYFKRMESIICRETDSIEDTVGALSAEDTASWGTEEFNDILLEGLRAWGERYGLRVVVETLVRGAESLILLAKEGAMIELLPHTTYLICRSVGKPESEMPWRSVPHGESIYLRGTYQFRVRMDGRIVLQTIRNVDRTRQQLALMQQ